MRRATSSIGERVFVTLSLLLFLSLTASGQVQVVGQLFREKIVNAGENYLEEIGVVNPSEEAIEVFILQADYVNEKGKDMFKKAGSLKWSNASWIDIPHKRYLLKGKRKAVLKFKISVPEIVEAGSYHSLLFIRTTGHRKKVEGGQSLMFNIQYGFQLVSTVRGGKKEAKIIAVKVEEDKLILDIENTGNEVLILQVKAELDLEPKRTRIYPEQIGQVIFDISNLVDKLYEDVRIILDDGKRFLKAEFITFRKGEEPRELSLIALKGQKIKERRKRKGKPYSLYANLNYGSRRRGLSLSGSLRQGDFSFMASSNYNEYIFGDVIQDSDSYQISASYRKKWFNIGLGSYIYSGQWISMFRTGFNFRSTRMNLHYGLKYKIVSMNISQRIFKKYFIRLYGFKSPYREDWSVSLSIPIL